ncbi:hypothetical protein BCR43DRAFT_557592 [Syncephalastrum racemosum]|uniref:Signal recognition particle subunit SRP72 n=1 Tax=Syncephalastrum racemosum TaxID=13706 RepID=A0A1X2H9T6_SYNRA|nr:hypothetical protein BCR43DRAFT_557592 [Syncephalastrum racemosum]
MTFERIYCYYRTNQLQPAFDLLKQVKEKRNDAAIKYLEAQLLYADEQYAQSIQLYEELLVNVDKASHLYEEIQVNLLAAKAALAFTDKDASPEKEPILDQVSKQASYEVAYNAASLHLARSDLDEARKQLETARKTCHEKLTEADTPQEEIDEELAVIATQLAYTYQMQGRLDDAMEIYQSVLDSGIEDPGIKAVASNNIVAVQQKKDVFDAAKKLKAASGKPVDNKLKRYQKRVIAMNDALLQLYMNKYSACRDAAKRLIETYGECDEFYLILASATYQQHKAEKAIEELKALAEKKPESVAIRFATIQLQLLQSQTTGALATLESYLSHIGETNKREYYRPALIALLVWLYEQTGQSQRAMELLEQASDYWKKDAKLGLSAPTSILKQTAAFKLKSGRYSEAAADYEELVREDPTDAQAVAGLVTAYIEIDPAKAEQYGNALPSIAFDHLDVQSLERSVPGVKRGYVRKAPSQTPQVKKNKNKKKRKPLLPKNYDPNNAPDPERWLPKYERSSYRVKGKNKKAASRGPQGAYVAGGGIGSTGSAKITGKQVEEAEQTSPPPEPAKQQKASGSKAANKKKGGKKKGKKW